MTMRQIVLAGLTLPFLGTALGAALALPLRGRMNAAIRRMTTGFAGGVMLAAAVWSLLIPAMEQCREMGVLCWVPAVLGYWFGALMLAAAQRFVPMPEEFVLSAGGRLPRGEAMMAVAIALHNLPEGMAVGAACAGLLSGSGVSGAAVLALAAGIAIQNVPEGAVISMPLAARGLPKRRAMLLGVLSGAVEPLGAMLTMAFAAWLCPAIPLLLGFAAGAMAHVTAGELIPQAAQEEGEAGTLAFSLGFTLMMALDVAL